MARVFICRPLPPQAMEGLAGIQGVEIWPEETPAPREILLEKVRDAEGILSLLTDRIDAEVMDAAPKLRVVSNMAVGYDNVDVAAATARGIYVGNTPGVLTDTTADLAFALMLAVARRIVEAVDYVRRGLWKTWHPNLFLGHDVHHATLGIVGMGRIGYQVARRARGFDMKILYYSRSRKPQAEDELGARFVELHDLLRESDFVSIHLPLTSQTHHLIGERELGLMKPTAVLVNTARGPIVDQAALYRALVAGRPGGAGLDVTDPEPIAPDDPLLTLPNVVVLPHIGSASYATRLRMALLAVENLLAGLRGEMPPHCVNPEARRARGES